MPNEEIYGVDYSSTGAVSSTGDILTVSGLDNARQAIRNELLTPMGSYPSMDDEYGSEIYKMHGEDLTKSQLQALTVYIENALLKQERVNKIENVEVKLTSEGLKAYLHVLLVNGSEEELTLDLEEDY
jgi:phage baseplate assembly protein W